MFSLEATDLGREHGQNNTGMYLGKDLRYLGRYLGKVREVLFNVRTKSRGVTSLREMLSGVRKLGVLWACNLLSLVATWCTIRHNL